MLNGYNELPIILASESPRRQMLLNQIGLKFQVKPPNIPELSFNGSLSAGEFVQKNAKRKARHVAGQSTDGIVIGADTIVMIDNTILEKPETHEEAMHMLELLNGREHYVYTGIALIRLPDLKSVSDCASTRVKFRSLTMHEIEEYVATNEPMGKAGAYAIQERGALLVEEIHGCYFNVVGLPISILVKLMNTLITEN